MSSSPAGVSERSKKLAGKRVKVSRVGSGETCAGTIFTLVVIIADVLNWSVGEVDDVMLNDEDVDGVVLVFVAANTVDGVVRPPGFGDNVDEG